MCRCPTSQPRAHVNTNNCSLNSAVYNASIDGSQLPATCTGAARNGAQCAPPSDSLQPDDGSGGNDTKELALGLSLGLFFGLAAIGVGVAAFLLLRRRNAGANGKVAPVPPHLRPGAKVMLPCLGSYLVTVRLLVRVHRAPISTWTFLQISACQIALPANALLVCLYIEHIVLGLFQL